MCCLAMKRRRFRRMASGEWRMGVEYGARPNHVLSRSRGLAGCNGSRGIVFSSYEVLSKIRTVRIDVADQTICKFNPNEYRRGPRAREHGFLRAVLSDCARLTEGTRNPLDSFKSRANSQSRSSKKINCGLRVCRTHAAGAHKVTASKAMTPFATRHSPFALERSSNV